MSVIIKKDDSVEEIRKAIQEATGKKSTKKVSLDKYFGKVQFDAEGLTYQKNVRDEWK
jgi:hypothetical protein